MYMRKRADLPRGSRLRGNEVGSRAGASRLGPKGRRRREQKRGVSNIKLVNITSIEAGYLAL